MPIEIRPLTAELCADFLHYFDNVAFCDHPEWSGCYCMEGHRSADEDLFASFGEPNRACARELVLAGKMRGYLAYDGGNVVGWCNADDKRNYRYLTTNPTYWREADTGLRIKVMYCLSIAADHRRQGLGTMLIQRVIDDALAEGYDAVEAYPWRDASGDYPYHGTVRMLERLGFVNLGECHDQHSEQYIYQKHL